MPLVVTGKCEPMQEARTQGYRRSDDITIQNTDNREDFSDRWDTSEADRLLAWGAI